MTLLRRNPPRWAAKVHMRNLGPYRALCGRLVGGRTIIAERADDVTCPRCRRAMKGGSP